jgi:rhomboid family GlyGly-CTERM serine protease
MSSPLRKFRPAARLLPWASLLVAVLAVGLHAFPAVSSALQFDREAIAAGEFWRVASCHLTHCSLDHLAWDVGVLLVLGWLSEVDNRRRWLVCVGLSTLAIPAAIWLLMPQLQTYRGLSGIDSALFVILGTLMLKNSVDARQTCWIWATAAAMLGFVLKTLYELTAAQTIFVDSAAAAMIPVPLAHIVGGLAGLIAALAHPAHNRPGAT